MTFNKSKKSKLAFLVAFLVAGTALMTRSSTAQAANGCFATTVIAVLDFPTSACGTKGAFMTAGSGGFWICAASDLQMRLAQAAYLSGRPTYYQLNGDNDCNPDASFTAAKAPTYLYMQ